MNILDIILLIPLIWLMYRGFQKGLIIELSSLIAFVLGIYFAINFSYFTVDFLTNNFSIGDKYLEIIAFIVTFIAIVIAVFFIGKLLEQVINIIFLGFVNKLAGAAFGLIKAAFLLSVILWIINSFDLSRSFIKDATREGSMLYDPIEQFAPTIIPKLSLEKLKNIDVPLLNGKDETRT